MTICWPSYIMQKVYTIIQNSQKSFPPISLFTPLIFLHYWQSSRKIPSTFKKYTRKKEKALIITVAASCIQLASVDIISSSAHQRGDNFGIAPSGSIPVISLNLTQTSFIVDLCLRSGLVHDLITRPICRS